MKLFSGTSHRTTFHPHSSLSHPAPRPQGRSHYLDEDAGSGERQKCLPKGPGGKTPICPLLQAFPTVAPMNSLGGCRGRLARTLHPSCCPLWLGTSWVTGTLCWTPWTCSCCGTVPVGAPAVLLELLLACTGDRLQREEGSTLCPGGTPELELQGPSQPRGDGVGYRGSCSSSRGQQCQESGC